MLALSGGMLYLFDLRLFHSPVVCWCRGPGSLSFYFEHIRERDKQGEPNVGLVVLLLNVHAYLLGAVSLALPNWVAVGTTVAAVLLLSGRERLHELARRAQMKEIIAAGQFLILTGLVLQLLPSEPVTTLTSITPRQASFALLAVCTLSYASYLAQNYWAPAAGGLWMAALGGLYSSTATTAVLARQAEIDASLQRRAQAGITLATGISVSSNPSDRGGVQSCARPAACRSTGRPFHRRDADQHVAILGLAAVANEGGTQTGQPKSA